jgi:hypothetical protein
VYEQQHVRRPLRIVRRRTKGSSAAEPESLSSERACRDRSPSHRPLPITDVKKSDSDPACRNLLLPYLSASANLSKVAEPTSACTASDEGAEQAGSRA